MKRLTCTRCHAFAEGEEFDFKLSRHLIDHSHGNHHGKPCYDGLARLAITGGTVTLYEPLETVIITTPTGGPIESNVKKSTVPTKKKKK